MPLRKNLPLAASQVANIGEKKLYSESASRNTSVIAEVLSQYLPEKGKVLELASGTGQHCTYFAKTFYNVEWQPSDIDPKRLDSIKAYIQEIDQANINAPLLLDVTASDWAKKINDYDAIITINIFHLISNREMKNLIRESSFALKSNGYFMIYGPFMRSGELIAIKILRFTTH